MDFFLAAALCLDTLFVCMAYGAATIQIPFRSKLLMSFVSTAALSISILARGLLTGVVDGKILKYIGFCVLLVIGLQNLFGTKLKSAIKRKLRRRGGVHLRLKGLSIVLSICADGTQADLDHSKTLSLKEAFLLSLSVSIDSLVTGLSIHATVWKAALLLAFSFIFAIFMCFIGDWIGKKLGNTKHDFSCLSGLILILIAIFKVI